MAILAACILLGQALLWLLGVNKWSWLAPSMGLATMIIIVGPTQVVPGGAATSFVVLSIATGAAACVLVPRRALWPTGVGLLAGIPVLAVALIPFMAAGWSGILGPSFNNDMANHLAQVEGLRPGGPADLRVWDGLGYPIGPHEVVAAISSGTDAPSALVFSALSLALPVILGWTSLGAIRKGYKWSPFPTALLVGIPFLAAAYYAQGAFKETALAISFLACVLLLWRPLSTHQITRWLPYAVIVAGALGIYSYAGLTWPIALLVAWAMIRGGLLAWRGRSLRLVADRVRANVLPAGLGVALLLVATLPILPRIYRFWQWEGVPLDNIGNLVGPLPFWEVLGAWNSNDFRLEGPYSTTVTLIGMLLGLAVLFGAAWSLRRGEWVPVMATVLAAAIWLWTDETQSAYVAAKTLAIMAPVVMLLAIRPCVERYDGAEGARALWKPVAAGILVLLQMQGTVSVLRASPVGPLDMPEEIRGLTALIGSRPALYLGNDDFTPWLFHGTPVRSPVVATPMMAFRASKPFEYGQRYDIDSLAPSQLDQFKFIVSPRDPGASSIPDSFRLIRTTKHFALYERFRGTHPRNILRGETGSASGAILDCASPEGRRIIRGGGVAGIRPPQVARPGATLRAGEAIAIRLFLEAGRWHLTAAYVSARPIRVSSPALGVATELGPYLGRPGPRWPIATVEAARAGTYVVRFEPRGTWLTPRSGQAGAALTYLLSVDATRSAAISVVPVAEACGQVVDWFRQ